MGDLDGRLQLCGAGRLPGSESHLQRRHSEDEAVVREVTRDVSFDEDECSHLVRCESDCVRHSVSGWPGN